MQMPPFAVSQEPAKLVPQSAGKAQAVHTEATQSMLPQSELPLGQAVPQTPVAVVHELMPQLVLAVHISHTAPLQ